MLVILIVGFVWMMAWLIGGVFEAKRKVNEALTEVEEATYQVRVTKARLLEVTELELEGDIDGEDWSNLAE